MKALIKYGFVFDPAETWAQQYEFDASFAAYLDSIGLDAELVKLPDGCTEYTKLLYISKKEVAPVVENNRTVKQVKAQLTTKRNDMGRFSSGNTGR